MLRRLSSFHIATTSHSSLRLFSSSPSPSDLIPSTILSALSPHLDPPHHTHPPPNIIVSVSSGPDSICLLRSLLLHPSLPKPHVVHFDHSTRPASTNSGTSSTNADDISLITSLCADLNLPLSIHKLPPTATVSQQFARTWRYDKLQSHAIPATTNVILTGHHWDDDVETFIMKLLRGVHLTNLVGMTQDRTLASSSTSQCVLIRPLLTIPKHKITNFCESNSWSYNVDPSNAKTFTPGYFRNTVRNALVPMLERVLESRDEAAAATGGDRLREIAKVYGEQSRELGEYLDAETGEFLATHAVHGNNGVSNLAVPLAAIGYIGKRGVHSWIARTTGESVSYKNAQFVFNKLDGKSEKLVWEQQVGGGVSVCR